MSYVVSTSTDTFSRGQNHSGGVQVSPCSESAALAPKSPYTQPKTRLVSRRAPGAGHCCVGGRHQHHRSTRPRATFDQLGLGCTDRSISTLARHRGLGQKSRFQVLDGDGLVVGNHTASPYAGRVLVLVRCLLVQFRRVALGSQVAVGRSLSARPAASTHLPLGLRQLSGATLPVPQIRQVVCRVGGGGRGGHTPVNADRVGYLGSGLDLTTDQVVQRLGVGAQCLLLSNLRSAAQPRRTPAGLREQFGELAQRGLVPDPVLVDGLIPEEAAAMPLSQQRTLRLRPRAQAVGVVHRLERVYYSTASILSSGRSKACRPNCSARSLLLSSLGCERRGPTRTSSPQSVAQPWRSSNAMSRPSATYLSHPSLPMAEAKGFSGAFR
jgi:hypothetical protein